MYNSAPIQNIIEKAKKEAADAAQKILNQYQSKLDAAIQNQLYKGDELYCGMGTCSVSRNKTTVKVNELFLRAIQDLQYMNVEASFDIKDYKK